VIHWRPGSHRGEDREEESQEHRALRRIEKLLEGEIKLLQQVLKALRPPTSGTFNAPGRATMTLRR
jgi:hypothetical protein